MIFKDYCNYCLYRRRILSCYMGIEITLLKDYGPDYFALNVTVAAESQPYLIVIAKKALRKMS